MFWPIEAQQVVAQSLGLPSKRPAKRASAACYSNTQAVPFLAGVSFMRFCVDRPHFEPGLLSYAISATASAIAATGRAAAHRRLAASFSRRAGTHSSKTSLMPT